MQQCLYFDFVQVVGVRLLDASHEVVQGLNEHAELVANLIFNAVQVRNGLLKIVRVEFVDDLQDHLYRKDGVLGDSLRVEQNETYDDKREKDIDQLYQHSGRGFQVELEHAWVWCKDCRELEGPGDVLLWGPHLKSILHLDG